ncbi:hypothetical protein [Pseudoalteromonas sp. ZZD1]|uniref:hypothetical protein n=1 Tax=Pseudoalteromonas sp. ZZD1 TaxID=3139395 RepID=UPI003BAABE19
MSKKDDCQIKREVDPLVFTKLTQHIALNQLKVEASFDKYIHAKQKKAMCSTAYLEKVLNNS